MFNRKNLTDFFKIVKKKYLGNQYGSVGVYKTKT